VDPDARDQLDDTLAQIARQTGAMLHTYPRPGKAARRVTLRDTRNERGAQVEAAQIDQDGTLRVTGHHTGPGVSDFFGAAITSYDWSYVIAAQLWSACWAATRVTQCWICWPATITSTAAR
jgi:hypothetical protein